MEKDVTPLIDSFKISQVIENLRDILKTEGNHTMSVEYEYDPHSDREYPKVYVRQQPCGVRSHQQRIGYDARK